MPIIKMDYEMMQQMRKEVQAGVEDLEDTMAEVLKIADVLEQGALVGSGGDAFVDAIRSTLTRKINELRDKLIEVDGDLASAVESMQAADDDAATVQGMN